MREPVQEGAMSARKATQKSAKGTTTSGKKSKGFTDEERAAMKERAQELKAEARKADGESAVLAKIAEMPEPDRALAERLHAIINASAPDLSPKTWYGMPAYAKDGKVVCYFQSAEKFKSRYATFGFSDKANLDEGAMWPPSFALKELTAAEEAKIGALVSTDGRASSFTRDFRPLHAFSRDRLRSLEAAFADGAFPPIVTVKLGETYFVIDGHHRAALARRGGAEMIDADVTELIARVPLPAGADMLEVVLRELERIFLEDSGLVEARPGVRVSVSRPAHYLELLENIQVHGYHLMRGRGRVLENAEIAADWFDAIYTPTLAAIERLRLGRLYRDAPPGDLFLVLHRHRRGAVPSTGCPPLPPNG